MTLYKSFVMYVNTWSSYIHAFLWNIIEICPLPKRQSVWKYNQMVTCMRLLNGRWSVPPPGDEWSEVNLLAEHNIINDLYCESDGPSLELLLASQRLFVSRRMVCDRTVFADI